ncbi:MAG: hypothetical protein GY943_05125 [Chloroflexi bacterium]|nr:hypothetical protein [Chloroflexota bacterium]
MWIFLTLITAVLCLLTVTGFLGSWYWLFELTSHFRWHLFLILMVLMMPFVWGGKPIQASLTLLFGFVNLLPVLPLFRPRKVHDSNSPSYRVLMLNVWYEGDDYCGVKALIEETNPDIVVLVEITAAWESALSDVIAAYPYWDGAAITRKYGVMFLSRIPLAEGGLYRLNDGERPSLIAHLDLGVGERPLILIGMHPAAPVRSERARIRNEQLEKVSQFIETQSSAVLLVGDLNMTPWSPHFNTFLRKSGLGNGRNGFGIQPSWPARLGIFGIPIDHALVSPDITIHQFKVGSRVGSDHLPIIVDFSLKD